MSSLDAIYRSFVDFRKTSAEDRDCTMQRTLVARADSDKDVVETVRYVCKIDEDWVEAIEKGMTFVEKAIAEERQFIRNNGEVVPIEKVKRVSRDSVEHLSRHSDLITKEPEEGKTVVPDQLYTVERLSDYAVYENRFLYMLLRYLEQFISMRYNKIVELANTYRGSLVIDKSVKTGTQNVTFKTELKEERRNDPLLSELNPNKSIIERIAMLLKMVSHYMKVPLMQEVSKSPLLRPPITVTNVLRMNHNFNGAMKLYEFVSSYDKLGYSAEKVVKKINPFPDNAADEFAEIEALASYLAYQYGMGVKDVLRANYAAEEERRREEREKRQADKLAALRRRVSESGGNAEEYMLELEKRIRILENDSERLKEVNIALDKSTAENSRLGSALESATELAADRLAQIEAMQRRYADKVAELEGLFRARLDDLNAEHAQYADRLRAEHAEALAQKDEIIADVERQKQQIVDDCGKQLENLVETHKAELAENARLVREKERRVAEVTEENKLLTELKTLSDGRLNALRYKHGYITDVEEYTTELAFNEIERQYEVFKDFFKRTWKKTRKNIRTELMKQISAENTAKRSGKELNAKADRNANALDAERNSSSGGATDPVRTEINNANNEQDKTE